MTTPSRRTTSISSISIWTSVVTVALAGVLVVPALAEAQRRGPVHRPRGGVVLGGGLRIGSGFGIATLSQRGWGQYGPWGYPRSYGYYTPYNEFNAAARIEVDRKDAEVYVDGSFAGLVDDFDGYWQRLNLRPGDHVITLYLDGHRTVRHELYFSPGVTHSIKGTMEKLGAGESAGPKPKPEPPPTETTITSTSRTPRAGQYPPNPPPVEAPKQPERFGTIALMIQPADAEVLVDGQRWTGASTTQRLSIKLSAGRHQIEVRKDGFTTYTETVLIRPDGTLTLNVGLTKK